MELLGVGPTELLFIIIIALIVLGPKDLQKTGRSVGKWLNSIVKSDTMKVLKKTSEELRQLPTTLMREGNLEQAMAEKEAQAPAPQAGLGTGRIGTGVVIPPLAGPAPAAGAGNSIQPETVILPSPRVETIQPAPQATFPAQEALPAKKRPARKTSPKPSSAKKSEKKTAKKPPATGKPRKKNADKALSSKRKK